MSIIIKIIEIFFDLFAGLLKFTFEAIESAFQDDNSYKADFASQGSILGLWEKGFCLTGNRNLSIKDSFQNALVVGGTGTGKSSIILLPSIYTMQGSLVIHDPSGELFSKSAGYLRDKGYEIKTLNFAHPQNSCGYNPLQRANSSSEIQKVASLLIQNALGENSKDPFWNSQGVALLSMLITILKKQPARTTEVVQSGGIGYFKDLYNVRLLLNHLGGSPEKIDKLFSDFADENLFNEYKSFLAYDDKVINGVIATCKASLQIFNDEMVASVTSFDSIDFSEFRKQPTALFIQNSVADQKYYSVLTSIFFEQFFHYIMSRFPDKEEQDIFFLIDECSSLKLPTLPLAVANVRKHRSGIMLIVQDFFQIVHHYGKYEADAIKSNCYAKLYLTGQSLETSKELEQTLGKFQYEDEKKRTVVRPLMTNDEIRTMKTDRALLICGNHPPVKVKLKPYYENGRFRSNDRIHPPASGGESCLSGRQVPFETVPVLDLNFIESE